MKIGNFYFSKKLLQEAEENLKNLNPEDKEKMLLLTKGNVFLATMMVEMMEADELINFDSRNEEEFNKLYLQILGSSVAIGVLNLASRSSEPAMFIEAFKHYFQTAADQIWNFKNDNT